MALSQIQRCSLQLVANQPAFVLSRYKFEDSVTKQTKVNISRFDLYKEETEVNSECPM
jgi:hypothetical protein